LSLASIIARSLVSYLSSRSTRAVLA